MKILSVRFKNISALEGECEIRFDRPPLADTGLFAIVGPNGSGKTNILDALTLALYGETPRLKNPETEVVSWRANDAYSEVSFSVGGSLYSSRWSVCKVNDKPQPPEMILSSHNGTDTVLEDRVIKVRSRVSELTGLDFKRFCRTILLAQGEFTAFLNALENERAEILEKIIGLEMARELEESIGSTANAEREKLLQLKEDARGASPLEKDQLDALRESLEKTEESLKETDGSLDALRSQEQWYERVGLLTSQHREASELLDQARTRHTQSKEDLERLKRAVKATVLHDRLEKHDDLKREEERATAQLHELEARVASDEDEVEKLEERLLQTRLELDQARERLDGRSEAMQNALLMDQEIAEENQRMLEDISRYAALERSRKEDLQPSEMEKRIGEAQKRQKDLDRWFQKHGGDGNLEGEIPRLEEIVARLKQAREQSGLCQVQESDALVLERHAMSNLKQAEREVLAVQSGVGKIAARKAGIEGRMGELLAGGSFESLMESRRNQKKRLALCGRVVKTGRTYERQQAQSEGLLTALNEIKSEQDTLAQSLVLEEARLAELEGLKKYAPDRLLLKSGKPCPLCGALEHPFVEQGYLDISEIERLLLGQRQKVGVMQKELKALRLKANTLNLRVDTMKAAEQAWIKACIQSENERLTTDPAFIRDEIRSQKTKLKEIKSRVRGVRWQNWRVKWVGFSLQRESKKLQGKEETRDRLQNEHESLRKAVNDLKSRLDSLREEKQAAKEELGSGLKTYGEQVPGPGREMELMERLRNRSLLYRNELQSRKDLADQLSVLETRKDTLPHELIEVQAQIDHLAVEIQAVREKLAALKEKRKELYEDMDPVRERRELEDEIALRQSERSSLEEQISSIRQGLLEKRSILPPLREETGRLCAAFEESERELTEQSKTLGFSSIDELRDSMLFAQEHGSAAEQSAAAEQALNEAKSRFDVVQSELERAQKELSLADSLETLLREIEKAQERHDQLTAKLQEINSILNRQQDLEREYRRIQEAIAQQEKVSARATAMQNMLQSEDPSAIKRGLQRLTLERLLEQSNQHLEVLSGRYSLQPLSEEGLGLQIEDSFQGRACRSLKTLSGGESFLVSLCLALGLSEMASKERKIESLFLDEGFGSLDDEMLYKVMAALKGLRANGKMVGVVSHVKRLADEISTRIGVEKQQDGHSRINLMA